MIYLSTALVDNAWGGDPDFDFFRHSRTGVTSFFISTLSRRFNGRQFNLHVKGQEINAYRFTFSEVDDHPHWLIRVIEVDSDYEFLITVAPAYLPSTQVKFCEHSLNGGRSCVSVSVKLYTHFSNIDTAFIRNQKNFKIIAAFVKAN